MLKRIFAVTMLVSMLGAAYAADTASAKRRCPRGYEDVNNVCVPVPGHT
jgi:hypothetical protein